MKVGILTGGGDCPGLNAVLRGFVLTAIPLGIETWGIRYGWKGLVDDIVNERPFDMSEVDEIQATGGTILKTSRTNPYKVPKDRSALRRNIARYGFEAIVAVGGDDTLGVAARLNADGIPAIGIPKTLDNDLAGTDLTFGFYSAVEVASAAIDRIRDTAKSHERILVVEVMGRHAGWVALYSALAGGADWVLIPELGADLDPLCERLRVLRDGGRRHGIVVVSEGLEIGTNVNRVAHERDDFGNVRLNDLNVAQAVAAEIERRTGLSTRFTSVGYVQRGGAPSAFDRILASRFGARAARAVAHAEFGTMIALAGNRLTTVPLEPRPRRIVSEEEMRELASMVGMGVSQS